MFGLIIKLEAITELHDPNPNKFYPAMKIESYERIDGNKEKPVPITHRCEDIYGCLPDINKDPCLQQSQEWLDANVRNLVQSLTNRIGGAYDAAILLGWLKDYLESTRGVTFDGRGTEWVGYEIANPENRFEGTFAEVLEWCYGEPPLP